MTTNVLSFPATETRSVSRWLTTQEVRDILKAAGYNASKVTVKCRHSQQYLDVTIRDASVSRAAVEKVIAPLHTWYMDNTDYCTGQSIHISTTEEVDAIHAAPWLELAASCPSPAVTSEGLEITPGIYLWNEGHQMKLSAGLNGPSQWVGHPADYQHTRTERTTQRLALAIAQLIEQKRSQPIMFDGQTTTQDALSEAQLEVYALGYFSMAAYEAAHPVPAPSPPSAPTIQPSTETLRAEFWQQLQTLLATITQAATAQFNHTIETNIPRGITLPTQAVADSLRVGLTKGWNKTHGFCCQQALEIAYSLLEDVNCHEECRALAPFFQIA